MNCALQFLVGYIASETADCNTGVITDCFYGCCKVDKQKWNDGIPMEGEVQVSYGKERQRSGNPCGISYRRKINHTGKDRDNIPCDKSDQDGGNTQKTGKHLPDKDNR